jgi:hypothetical protein
MGRQTTCTVDSAFRIGQKWPSGRSSLPSILKGRAEAQEWRSVREREGARRNGNGRPHAKTHGNNPTQNAADAERGRIVTRTDASRARPHAHDSQGATHPPTSVTMHSFVSARSGAGGGSSGGERGGGGGATAVMEHVLPALACPFVVRTHRGYDEDVLDDVDNGVYRSTPATHAAFGSPALSNHSMEFVPGYSVSARDDMSPTQLVRAVQFSSLATVFPLSHHGTNNLLHASVKAEDPPVFQNHTASTTMGSDSGYRSQFMSTADRATPPLTSIAEMTQLDEQTILNRSVTIKKESGADDDRLSPFGALSAQEAQPYQYNATKSELDEMEVRGRGLSLVHLRMG